MPEFWANRRFYIFLLKLKTHFSLHCLHSVSSHSPFASSTHIPTWMRKFRRGKQCQSANLWSPNSTCMSHEHRAPLLPPRPSASTPSTFLRSPSLPLLVQRQMIGPIRHRRPPPLQLHPEVPMCQRRRTVMNYLTRLNLLLPAKACPIPR